MKKTKKIIIALMVSLLLVFSITPKRQDKVEAFAITGTALAIGAIATIIVGGSLVSEAVTETYGNEIIDYVAETGQNISDFLNYDNKTKIMNLMTSAVVLNAIREVTTEKVNQIDTVTKGITNSNSLNYGILFNSTDVDLDQKLNLSNPGLLKSQIETRTPLTLSLHISEPLVTDMWFVIGQYVGNRTVEGTLFTFKKGMVGNQQSVQTLSGRSSAPVKARHNYVEGDMVAVIDPYFISSQPTGYYEYTFSNVTFTETNLSIPVDTIDQFGNVARGAEQIQDRINTQVQTNVNYDFSIPTDVTTIRDLPSITTGTAESDMDIPTDDTPSGIFAVVHNIWNLLKSIPNRVANAFKGLFEYVVGAIQAFMEMISSMFGSLMGMLGSIIDTVWSAVSPLSTAIYNIGTNIVNSIWDGVNRVLWDIEAGIRGLAGDVRDLLINLPDAMSGLWEDAGIIWTGLTNGVIDSINTGIDNVNTFADNIVTSIDNVITDVITGIISIVIPTEAVREDITANYNTLKNTFMFKFDFLISPIKSMVNVYNKPRSLYDLYITIMDTKVFIFPRIYEGAVDVIRIPLTGVFVLMTIIHIYKKGHKKAVI